MDYGTLRVTTPDGQVREYPIDVATAFVGRAEGNRVVIDHVTVSRRHARLVIDSGRLMVEDLGSATGTFVGSQRIPPHSPSLVEEGQPIRFGDVEALFLGPAPAMPGVDAPAGSAGPSTAPTLATEAGPEEAWSPPEAPLPADGASPPPGFSPGGPSGPASMPAAAQPISVSVQSPAAAVAAGSPTTATVVLQNRGTVVDEFSLSVPDLPADWVRISRAKVPLLPGARDEVTIVFQPPRSAEARAGEHPFAVAVVSRDLGVEVRALGKLVVLPFDGFQMTLRPVRARRDFKVVTQNTGNAPADVTLAGVDDEGGLKYRFEPEHVELPAGTERAIALRVRTRGRRWFGPEEVKAFRVEARFAAAGAQTQTVDGQLRSRATLEAWKWPLALVLLAGLLGGGAWGYRKGCRDGWPVCRGSALTSPLKPPTPQPTRPGTTPTLAVITTPTRPVSTPTPAPATATPGITAKFKPGDLAVVTGTDSCLYVRFGPGLSNNAIVCLKDGEQVTITGGPEVSDGLKWWKVQSASGEGWSAEDYLTKRP